MKTKYYFENEDAEICRELDYYLHDAKIEGKETITLLRAYPDKHTKDYVWCKTIGEVQEIESCRKAICPYYESKSGRGVCSSRGQLYNHGEAVTFNVETGEEIKPVKEYSELKVGDFIAFRWTGRHGDELIVSGITTMTSEGEPICHFLDGHSGESEIVKEEDYLAFGNNEGDTRLKGWTGNFDIVKPDHPLIKENGYKEKKG